MRTAAQNITALASHPPTLHLSGGRDSRLTSAAFLSLSTPFRVLTFGDVSAESETAKQLAELAGERAQHEIIKRGTDSMEEMTISQRQTISMAIWDGDMNPNRLSQRFISPAPVRQLTITGGGGEIAHGNYYASRAMLDRVQKLTRRTDRLVSAFTGLGVSLDAAGEVKSFCDSLYEDMARLGLAGPTMLDAFYLTERFRRWVAAGHNTSSPLLFGSPSFVRYSMDQTPDARLANQVHSDFISNLIPNWRGVPFFKAKPSDRDEKLEKGLRIWQGERSEEFFDVLLKATNDPLWDGRSVLGAAVEVLRGNSQPRMESVFQRVLWRQGFITHMNALNRDIQKAWDPIRESSQASPTQPRILSRLKLRRSPSTR
ncbi:hypothetical protein AAIB41_02410 [Brucella sp. BE17]|uniref:hypothetical protein n=1 Tax=Brucella sp. BE17 TaxID=3142977 RepID=UPI0031BA3CA8